MSEPIFDAEGMFDDDYLYFFADALKERSDAETGVVWELLGLEPGQDVLDLCCGHGRIANRLAARGCRVTGLDATPLFLERARREAGAEVDYVLGDMRDLPYAERFDAVVCWFTSFGYFDDDGNRRVLEQVHGALRPGGRFAVELINYTGLLARYQNSVVIERGEDMVVDQHRIDPLTGRSLATRTVIRDGRIRRVPFFTRLFTFPELRDWLMGAGFRDVEGYGDGGGPLVAGSRRMVVTARR
ncbi:class I SAM-dependent methyltransferase [Actinomadura barringtoniae]|uniref:Class I SAM-dependent methyltransferase n=1 Tax=Actinomadura barringtoniae TaxID=1427535 RepID=A0A939PFZ9_9ACTN|nr:class I SAM-dependent methyltransferase [Actinomadura barringtoniae]MBO2448504.1 class I SAM-dependent methyltransferase [Actinomadura barringtoniae]